MVGVEGKVVMGWGTEVERGREEGEGKEGRGQGEAMVGEEREVVADWETAGDLAGGLDLAADEGSSWVVVDLG